MPIKDDKGADITVDRLVGVTWELLENARASAEVDHAACGKYIELIAKVLLPKTDGGSGGGVRAQSLKGLLDALSAEKNTPTS